MEFKFDEKFLKENNLSPNQMLILVLINEGKRTWMRRLAKGLTEDPFAYDFDRLADKGLVEGDIYTDSQLTEASEEMLSGENQFEELLKTFPTSVIRQDGQKDYLRTDKRKAERMYKKITRGRKDIHEHIMSCLNYEIEQRTITNNMMWMKKLPNWLNSNEWEVWSEKMKDDDLEALFGKEEEEYGTAVE